MPGAENGIVAQAEDFLADGGQGFDVVAAHAADGSGEKRVAHDRRLQDGAFNHEGAAAGAVPRSQSRADKMLSRIEEVARSKGVGAAHRFALGRPGLHPEFTFERGQCVDVVGVAVRQENGHDIEVG